MDPYKPVPTCREHPRHKAGCPNCRRYGAWKERRRKRELAAGRPLAVPVATVRAHLDQLLAAGVPVVDIAARAGVHPKTISDVRCRRTGVRVHAANAEALLAVPVPAVPVHRPSKSNLIDATGSARRIRALARIGWTYRHIAEAAGPGTSRLEDVPRNQWITRRAAAGIARAYDLLWQTRGPSTHTARRAERAGWPPPLAWDDAAIDDPAARPYTGSDDDCGDQGGPVWDEITVEHACSGLIPYARLNAHRPDLVEAVRRLAARGLTAEDIAHRLRWPGASLARTDGKSVGGNAVARMMSRQGIRAAEPVRAVVTRDDCYRNRRPKVAA